MKVILKQDIKGVGKADDIVNVASGYGRNYLFPRNLAVEANDANVAERQKRHDVIDRKGEKLRGEAEGIGQKLADAKLTIQAKGGTGTKLYGSITAQDIADAVKSQIGVDLDKRKIHIQEPIKTSGTHSVPVRLHRDVGVDLNVEVVTE